MCTKNKDGKGKGNSHSTSLAHSTVVYKVDGISYRQSNNNPKNQKLVKNSISGQKTPLQETLVLIACLVSGNCIENEVFSKQTVNIIMSSWKLGTKKQYRTFTKRWFQYCSEEQVNSVRPTLDNILEFLTSLFDKGLGYSSLNTIRGALSALGIKCDGHLVGSHPLVVRYMKGVYNLRPTLARCF